MEAPPGTKPPDLLPYCSLSGHLQLKHECIVTPIPYHLVQHGEPGTFDVRLQDLTALDPGLQIAIGSERTEYLQVWPFTVVRDGRPLFVFVWKWNAKYDKIREALGETKIALEGSVGEEFESGEGSGHLPET